MAISTLNRSLACSLFVILSAHFTLILAKPVPMIDGVQTQRQAEENVPHQKFNDAGLCAIQKESISLYYDEATKNWSYESLPGMSSMSKHTVETVTCPESEPKMKVTGQDGKGVKCEQDYIYLGPASLRLAVSCTVRFVE